MSSPGSSKKGRNRRRGRAVQQTLEASTRKTITLGNFYAGDPIQEKGEKDYRIYFQNINGIPSENGTFAKADQMFIEWRALGVDIGGMAETKINANHHSNPKGKIRKFLTSTYGNYSLEMASSGIRTKNVYQAGGVLSYLSGGLSGRKVHHFSDPMGRWSSFTIQGTKRKLTIITAYQVCRINKKTGNTAAIQQRDILRKNRENRDDNIEPRKAFIVDLGLYIAKEMTETNHEILLMLDANECIFDGKSPLRDMMEKNKLADIHAHYHVHEHDEEWATYARGSKQIDYMIGTSNVVEFTSRCGMEEFDSHSDHRGLWLDIDLEAVLGGQIPDLVRPQHRGVSGKDPKQVRKFRGVLLKFLEQHNVQRRVEKLNTMIENEASEEAIERLMQAIDRDIEQGMLAAEKKVARQERPPWSPRLIAARAKMNYFRCWLTELRNGKDYTRQRKNHWNRAKEAGGEIEFDESSKPTSVADMRQELRKAQKAFLDVIKTAQDERMQHLGSIAKEKAKGNPSKQKIAKIVKGMLISEKMARIHSKLKRVTKPEQRGKPIDHLLVREPNCKETDPKKQKWIVIRLPEEIQIRTRERNIKHFAQANGTPGTVNPIKEVIGFAAHTAEADAILEGVYNLEKLELPHEASRDFLRAMGETVVPEDQKLKDEELCVTEDVVFGWFKAWRLGTSTSPSGLHLGLWKSAVGAVFPDEIADSEDSETEEKPTTHGEFLKCITSYFNSILKSGKTPKRWKKTINLMLEKIAGKPFEHKLRVIHIIEADANAIFGEMWNRKLQPLAEKHGALGEEDWGCRKGRAAQDVLALKALTYELMHLTKLDGATFDNDAKACFDRIVKNIMMLQSRNLGMTKKACITFVKFLRGMQFHQKTQVGTSEAFFEALANLIEGVGQGAKWSAIMWSQISPVLKKLSKLKSGGITFESPTGRKTTSRGADGFVDDATLWRNFFHHLKKETPEVGGQEIRQLIRELEEAAQYWEQLLDTTGGKLELEKCFYYIIHWEFDSEGRATLASADSMPRAIRIRESQSGMKTVIEQKDCSEPHKTLGGYISPLLQNKKQFEIQRDYTQKLAIRLGGADIGGRQGGHMMAEAYINPKLNYVAPSSMFTKEQATKIQSPVTRALLPLMGFNRNTPKAMVYAPISVGGIGLPHHFSKQGKTQACQALRHVRHSSPLGDMIEVTYEWVMLLAGISTPALEDPAIKLPHLPGRWVESLREFLAAAGGEIVVEGIRCPTKRRTRDIILMDECLKRGYSQETVRQINRVRVFLQVETLAELSNADGTALQPFVLTQWEARVNSKSTMTWPNQTRPGKRSFQSWRKLLVTFHDDGKLKHHLGPWINTSEREWNHGWDPVEKQIFTRRKGNSCTYYLNHEIERRRIVIPQETDTTMNEVPAVYAPVDETRDRAFSKPQHLFTSKKKEIEKAKTWEEYVELLPEWERDLLQKRTPPTSNLVVAMSKIDTIKLVSNGEIALGHGSYGWIIATKSEDQFVNSNGRARGRPMQQLRAECYGALALLAYLYHATEYFGISEYKASLVWICSYKPLIDRLENYQPKPWTHWTHKLPPDEDVVIQIHEYLEKLETKRYKRDSNNCKPMVKRFSKLHQGNVEIEKIKDDDVRLSIIVKQLATSTLNGMNKIGP